jgi:predicted Fe-Mo cluster-binding NifX family protein
MTNEFLVAVTTRDGQAIDLHFGHAQEFVIYALGDGAARLVETRSAACYCHEDSDEARRAAVMELLADCRAVFTARIGDTPRQRLQKAGLSVVTDYPFARVSEALAAWWMQQITAAS